MATLQDPVQSKIVMRLVLQPGTCREVAEDTGLRLEVVRREVRKLWRGGQIGRGEKARPRSRPEYLYSADHEMSLVSTDEIGELPRRSVEEAYLRILRAVFREAVAAIDAGSFSRRPERDLARLSMPLDRRRFREAIKIHDRLLLAVMAEGRRASRRLARDGEEAIEAIGLFLFFEFPLERWPQSVAETLPARRRRRSRHRVEKILDLNEPLRSALIDTLGVMPASAGELAARLEVPVSKVRYELERLLADEFVRVLRRKPSRGTVERVFVADLRKLWLSGQDLLQKTPEERKANDRWLVTKIFREALETIRAEGPREMADVVIARVPMALDVEGFRAVSTLIDEVLEELLALRESSLASLGETETPGYLGISDLLLFERAPSAP